MRAVLSRPSHTISGRLAVDEAAAAVSGTDGLAAVVGSALAAVVGSALAEVGDGLAAAASTTIVPSMIGCRLQM
jgi:hypothetical protein